VQYLTHLSSHNVRRRQDWNLNDLIDDVGDFCDAISANQKRSKTCFINAVVGMVGATLVLVHVYGYVKVSCSILFTTMCGTLF
jgi:hypothetical protein